MFAICLHGSRLAHLVGAALVALCIGAPLGMASYFRGPIDRLFTIILAKRVTGARHRRILWREIGPNIAIRLSTYLLLLSGAAILTEGAFKLHRARRPVGKCEFGAIPFS